MISKEIACDFKSYVINNIMYTNGSANAILIYKVNNLSTLYILMYTLRHNELFLNS